MKPSKFLAGLVVMCAVQAGLIWVIIQINPAVLTHAGFMMTAMTTMVVFCCMMYLGARIMVKSKLTRLFIQLIMIAVFLKMLVCLALIVGYKNGFDPTDDLFIWPFLMIYITTTIYEVIFLEKVGREKQTPAS
jgi:hypothetical protein